MPYPHRHGCASFCDLPADHRDIDAESLCVSRPIGRAVIGRDETTAVELGVDVVRPAVAWTDPADVRVLIDESIPMRYRAVRIGPDGARRLAAALFRAANLADDGPVANWCQER